MQAMLVQFLAALAQQPSRLRFAELATKAGHWVPISERADRLLINSGVLKATETHVTLVEDHLTALLDFARDQAKPAPDARLERLPRRRRDRVEALRQLAASVLVGGERVSETVLGERLEPLVVDVAAARRAMIDEGVLDRHSATQTYWLPAIEPEDHVSD